ncbi:MAG: branched-chain amino acid transaminase [Candidatus Dadabacteria bacterium]|nr:branched-chain amino acid transaminase [Candidatus Dadabacteria bacterium]
MSNIPYKIWFNGEFVPWDEANVHILTHTLHYGLAVFEGIRAYKCDDNRSAVFRLKEHVDRLYSSAHIANIKIPFTKEQTTEAILELLSINELDAAYIRPIAYIGSGKIGLHPGDNPIELAIAAYPWGTYLGEGALSKGITTKISSLTRMGVNSFMTKAKISGNYVNSVMAKVEATSLGFDEAILLDNEGYVAEGSGENIFIVRNGVLKTPPLASVLEGITRDAVIQIAKEEGLNFEAERFTRDELYIADEAFFTGTAAEITPIREVDKRMIGQGKPGPVTKKLQSRFFDIVQGRDPKFIDWLEFFFTTTPLKVKNESL